MKFNPLGLLKIYLEFLYQLILPNGHCICPRSEKEYILGYQGSHVLNIFLLQGGMNFLNKGIDFYPGDDYFFHFYFCKAGWVATQWDCTQARLVRKDISLF